MTTALEGGKWSAARSGRILHPGKTRTHCTGGWVGPRAGLDGRKISPHRDSIPGPSSPKSVAIPTELPGPLTKLNTQQNLGKANFGPKRPKENSPLNKMPYRTVRCTNRYTSEDLWFFLDICVASKKCDKNKCLSR